MPGNVFVLKNVCSYTPAGIQLYVRPVSSYDVSGNAGTFLGVRVSRCRVPTLCCVPSLPRYTGPYSLV